MRSPDDLGVVVVLDGLHHGGRRLAETVRGTGLSGLEADSVSELIDALTGQTAAVGVIAFEQLWPEPQRNIKRILDSAPHARLIGVFTQGAPRRALGDRLWAAGLLEQFVPRSIAPHELRPTLQQAFNDALIDNSTGTDRAALQPGSLLAFLRDVTAAFATQTSREGILRELRIRLDDAVPFDIAQILVLGDVDRLYVAQSRPLPHHRIWQLAQQVCASATPLRGHDLSPDNVEIVWDDGAYFGANASAVGDAGERVIVEIPLAIGGDYIGVLAIDIAKATTNDAEVMAIVNMMSRQLAISLRNAQVIERARQDSLQDALTGAYNRRYLKRALEAEWSRADRYNHHLSLALVDLDHFKRVNDSHGHLVGDEVLRGIADLLRDQLRATDHIVRYGGEEFLLILPETRPSEAVTTLSRIQQQLRARGLPIRGGETLRVTFSAGIASQPICRANSSEELIELADMALYDAKRAGRDRVNVATRRDRRKRSDSARNYDDRRRYPRLSAKLRVRYVALPEFDARSLQMSSVDVGAGGLAVVTTERDLTVGEYAVVYIEGRDKPVLSKVAWTRPMSDTENSAGLQFVSAWELGSTSSADGWDQAKAALLCTDAATLRVSQRVLAAARCDVTVIEAASAAATTDFRVAVIDAASIATAAGLKLCEHAARTGAAVIALSNGARPDAGMRAVVDGYASHALAADDQLEEALSATLHKLRRASYFGIQQYLFWGTTARQWRVFAPHDKGKVLTGVKHLAQEVSCHPRVADLLLSGLDEMLTAALSHPGHGDSRQTISVECGSDGRLLAVGVSDPFGTTTADAIRKSLAANGDSTGSSNELAMQLMRRSLSRLAFDIKPGVRTEVIGVVDLRKGLRAHRAAPTSVGLFVAAPGK